MAGLRKCLECLKMTEQRVLIIVGDHAGKMGTVCKERPVGFMTANVLVDGETRPTTMSLHNYVTREKITRDIADSQQQLDRHLERLSMWKD